MPALTSAMIASLLQPFYLNPSSRQLDQLSIYLDLMLKWNARTNLTAIRLPEEIVRRHFGESLFAALHLPMGISTLLDLGSGAGLPGLPIQIVRPDVRVTLAESQGKKASFLWEVVRTLGLDTQVWSQRASALPSTCLFDVVTLRAVDSPEQARAEARTRLLSGGWLYELGVKHPGSEACAETLIDIPDSRARVIRILRS